MDQAKRSLRKTVGVLINEIDGWYGSLIIRGIKEVAAKRNINLVIFPGRAIKSTFGDEAQRNIIYEIVNKEKLDGLIITSASLFNFIKPQESNIFLENFKEIPIVSISMEVTDSCSVVFDNKLSMYSVVKHLIEHHNYTRIAFIMGPSSSREAKQRYEGYLKALMEHNIQLEKNYVVEGDFSEESGTRAMEELYKHIDIEPQAIVSSNDQMAIGASRKLKEMGFKIGKDIALTGFDNSDEVNFFYPPLTTVSQPTYKLGLLATELICDLLEGNQVNRCVKVEGELVVRQSCGCLNLPNKKSLLCSENINKDKFEVALKNFISNLEVNKQDIVISILKHFTIPDASLNDIKELMCEFLEDIVYDLTTKNVTGRFIEKLNYILNENTVLKEQCSKWNNFVLSMRQSFVKYCENYEMLGLINDIFYTACILVNSILIRFEAFESYKFRKLFRETRQTTKDFNNALTLEELIVILRSYLSAVNIEKCYLCLFDEPVISNSNKNGSLPEKTKLYICDNSRDKITEKYFNVTDMLPDEYLYPENRSELLFLPLFVGKTHFGYIVFSMNNIDENVFESLREYISHSLNSQLLLSKRKKAEKQLQLANMKLEKYNAKLHNLTVIDELTGLYNRRGFYEQSNKNYERAIANNEGFILFYGDLDGLKEINDCFGHKCGDEALKAAGKILEKAFRSSDVISRIGGDEFTALATNISKPDSLNRILEKINKSFTHFNESKALPFKVSMSIGYSIFEPGSGRSIDELIHEADIYLYKQKKQKKCFTTS